MTMPDGNQCNMWHVPARFAKNVYNISKKVACVKRHPYLRLLSEYTYLISVPWGVNASARWNDHLLDHEACSEESINEFLMAALTNMEQGQRYQHDCHFVPQAEYVWDEEGHQLCNEVIDVKDMPHAFNVLLGKSGFSFQIPEDANQTHNGHGSRCPGLSIDRLWRKTRRLIRKVYRDDFVKLGYHTNRV